MKVISVLLVIDYWTAAVQSRDQQEKQSVNLMCNSNPAVFPELLNLMNGIAVKCLLDMKAKRCFISYEDFIKYFGYKMLKFLNLVVHTAEGSDCLNKGLVELRAEICSVEKFIGCFMLSNV